MPTGSNRRARSDSAASAVAAFREASETVAWPEIVEPMVDPAAQAKALLAFGDIIKARAVRDWHARPSDILLAAQMAKVIVMGDQLGAEIERDGWTVASPKHPESKVRNPALDALGQLSSRALALGRMLGLAGGPADRRTVTNNARAAADTRDLMEGRDPGSRSLLAGGDDDAPFAQPPGRQ